MEEACMDVANQNGRTKYEQWASKHDLRSNRILPDWHALSQDERKEWEDLDPGGMVPLGWVSPFGSFF
jgi:hypothetical protein